MGPLTEAGLQASLLPMPSLQALEAMWTELEARAAPSFFLSWYWIGTWVAGLPAGVQARLVRVQMGDRVVGLGILVRRSVRRHRVLSLRSLFLNCTGDPLLDEITIEHNGLLAQAGMEAAVTQAAVDSLRAEMGRWDEVVFERVDLPDVVLATNSGRARWRELVRMPSYYVNLDAVRASGKPLAAALSSGTRYQLQRSIRRYEQFGPLAIEEATDMGTAERFFERLVELHQRHWIARGMPGSFANAFLCDFHRRLIALALPHGVIQLLRITAGTTELGYLYNHVYRGRVYVYQTGFDYSGDGPYDRPGVVSHALAIEHNVGRGHCVYDFSPGNVEYKQRMSNASTTVATLVLQAPRVKLRLEELVRNLRRTWRVRGHVAPKP